MALHKQKTHLVMDGGFCFQLALALLILPVRWIFAWMLAAAFHELCHYAAVRLCGGRIHLVRIGVGGAVMETGCLSGGGGALCAIAGPLGSFALLGLLRWMPIISFCGLVQGLCNLIPVYPLDGECFVRRILECTLPTWTSRICRGLELLSVFAILGISTYLTVVKNTGWPGIAVAGYLLLRNIRLKKSCKPWAEGVQ